MDDHIKPVELQKAYRLINHGPTVLVSARHGGVTDVMAAAWCCGLDIDPPRLTVVIDKASSTRALMEASGRFVIQVPTVRLAPLTRFLGTHSLADDRDKMTSSGLSLFEMPHQRLPFVQGCSGWLVCRLIPEPHVHYTYDLFIAQVEAAWADSRVFWDNHWHFEDADPGWRSIHHVAGGQFYAIGEALTPEAGSR